MYAVRDSIDGRYYVGPSGFSASLAKARKYSRQDAEEVAAELGRNAGDASRYNIVEAK